MRSRLQLAITALITAPVATASAQATHTVLPTPTTVAWGYYDAAAAPVLHIRSGDVIVVGTLIYMVTSVSCDVDITELVDGNVGVHVMIPKSIFPRGAGDHMIPVKH